MSKDDEKMKEKNKKRTRARQNISGEKIEIKEASARP